MEKPSTAQLSLALCCLASVLPAMQSTRALDGTEFSGGWLTGPLLLMVNVGTLLFAAAFVLAFILPRSAAAIAILSSLACAPLYLFFLAPEPFARFFGTGHELLVPHSAFWSHWGKWALGGLFAITAATFVSVRMLVGHRRPELRGFSG